MNPEHINHYKASQKIGLFGGILALIVMLLMPAPEAIGEESWKVIAAIVFILCWWVSEAVPIAVTALTPIVIFPLLNIMTTKEVTISYTPPVAFLFLGGAILACAIQKWKLNVRISLAILKISGTKASNILAGFMIATAFLSMWMSNTASTLIMLPIGLSVLALLKEDKVLPQEFANKFSVCLLIGIAFAANIGGTATLIGTIPNALFAAFMKSHYNHEISFFSWMMIGVPFAITCLILCWLLLKKTFHIANIGNIKGSDIIINKQWANLGKITHEEKFVTFIFTITALLWIIRPLLGIKGLDDTIIAIISSIALFSLPIRFKPFKFLLSWEDTKNLPWGIILLLGGGLAMAAAMKNSGLVLILGNIFSETNNLSYFLIALITITSALFMTEFMSNTAIASIILPIVAIISTNLGQNPVAITIAVTLATSCAFMLPMATPPNAIVFSSGYIHMKDMIKVGIFMNIITIITVMMFLFLVMPHIISTF